MYDNGNGQRYLSSKDSYVILYSYLFIIIIII